MASNSDDAKPMMQNTVEKDRDVLTRRIGGALSDHQDRTDVRSFDGATGVLKVDVYPDPTRQDAPRSFTVKITHDLD